MKQMAACRITAELIPLVQCHSQWLMFMAFTDPFEGVARVFPVISGHRAISALLLPSTILSATQGAAVHIRRRRRCPIAMRRPE